MRKINFSKKPLSVLTIILAIIVGATFQSCQDEALDISEDGLFFNGKHYTQEEINLESKKITEADIFKTLNEHYEISKVIKSPTKFSKSLKSNLVGSDYQVIEYVFKNSNEHLYIAQNIQDANEYEIIKTIENKNKIEILNSTTLYHNNLISSSLKMNHKKFMKSNEFDLKSLMTINVANAEWCQQESVDNGSSSACQDREYDEFVEDDWVAFVAYWTNPQIAILIAAMCSC